MKLQITLGALTTELGSWIDDNQSERDRITRLGDEAYFSGATRTDVVGRQRSPPAPDRTGQRGGWPRHVPDHGPSRGPHCAPRIATR